MTDLIHENGRAQRRPSHHGKLKTILPCPCCKPKKRTGGRKKRRPPCYTRAIMNRLLTTLLVWLLMAMLPLHAVAASVKPSYAPVRHHTGTPSLHEHAASSAAGDVHAHHDEHAAHSASGPHATHSATAATAADAAAGANADAPDVPHSSCSACSVFCVGAVAPPSALLSVPSVDGSESVVSAPADSPTGFIPDGPQRPPRR